MYDTYVLHEVTASGRCDAKREATMANLAYCIAMPSTVVSHETYLVLIRYY